MWIKKTIDNTVCYRASKILSIHPLTNPSDLEEINNNISEYELHSSGNFFEKMTESSLKGLLTQKRQR